KPNARAEVQVVVVGQFRSQRAADGPQFLEGAAVGNGRAPDQIEVLVPAQSQIHAQPVRQLPIVLEIEAEHLGCDNESWITGSGRHALDQARLGKSLGISKYLAGNTGEIDFQSGIKFEETAEHRLPQIVEPGLEAVVAVYEAQIILELKFSLERLLGNIGVGPVTEPYVAEGNGRFKVSGADQIVPILET